MGGVADNPDGVIFHMQNYAEKYRDVINAIDDLEKKIAKALSDRHRGKRPLVAETAFLNREIEGLKSP